MARIEVKCPKCKNKFMMYNDDRTACPNCGFVITGTDYGSGGCFVTTACVKSVGLPDDCHELKMMRNFRDTYLKSHPQGAEIISEYYSIAPAIVEKINERNDAKDIYQQIYTEIVHSVALIENKHEDEAFDKMIKSYKRLKEAHLNN